MILQHLVAMTLAVVIDKFVGDPPHWPHPVKFMGNLIAFFDRSFNKGRGRKMKGMLMLLLVLAIVWLIVSLITYLAFLLHPVVGVIIEALLISTSIARKSLTDAAMEVYEPLRNDDLQEARLKLSYIVGRDTDQLNESEIVRGTVETVAENTSDGVTAPLFWSLVGGAPLALLYRAINTCDSMVGYKNDRYLDFGWASARMDDVANFIPSRLTGLVMVLVNPAERTAKREVWNVLFRDARNHPSPNSGWCEAAAAGLLGVQLGGRNTYKGIVSHRALMGDPLKALDTNDILKMDKILKRTVVYFFICLWLGGILIDMAVTWF